MLLTFWKLSVSLLKKIYGKLWVSKDNVGQREEDIFKGTTIKHLFFINRVSEDRRALPYLGDGCGLSEKKNLLSKEKGNTLHNCFEVIVQIR